MDHVQAWKRSCRLQTRSRAGSVAQAATDSGVPAAGIAAACDRARAAKPALGAEVDVRSDATRAVGVIRTTDQSPSRTFQVRVWFRLRRPRPPRRLLGRRPLRCASGDRQICDMEGIEVEVLDIAWATDPRYLATSACGPMPMKSVFSPGSRRGSEPCRTSSRQDPALSVGVNLEPRARQGVGRGREPLARRRQVAVLALCAVGPAGSLRLPSGPARTGPRCCRGR